MFGGQKKEYRRGENFSFSLIGSFQLPKAEAADSRAKGNGRKTALTTAASLWLRWRQLGAVFRFELLAQPVPLTDLVDFLEQ